MLSRAPNDIQKQIDQMKEQINDSLSFSRTALKNSNEAISHIMKIERENGIKPYARETPDSEGFWRDDDGDVWVCDREGTTRLIAKGHKQGEHEIYDLSIHYMVRECGPYIKIDNPFIQGENHAN